VITIAVLSGGYSSGRNNSNATDVPSYLGYQGKFTERYVTGPIPDKDAILVLDPKYIPSSPYLELKLHFQVKRLIIRINILILN
jgi:hypothetical protein